MKRRSLDVIRVFSSPLDPCRGRIRAGSFELRCSLGSGGVVRTKREGDGGTPAGQARALSAFYRADRVRPPQTLLPLRKLRPTDGWCEDPASRRYNQPVLVPFEAPHERMWRDDALYDVVVDLSYNRRPVIRGRGSAIFLHVARPGLTPTQGCVAVEHRMIHRLMARIGPRTRIVIRG